MHGDADTFVTPCLDKDVVTADDASNVPAVPTQGGNECPSRDLLHTANSRTRAPAAAWRKVLRSTDRQPAMASRRFARSSARVSPCVAHPGIAGTSAQYPPSSASCTTAWNLMQIMLLTLPAPSQPASAGSHAAGTRLRLGGSKRRVARASPRPSAGRRCVRSLTACRHQPSPSEQAGLPTRRPNPPYRRCASRARRANGCCRSSRYGHRQVSETSTDGPAVRRDGAGAPSNVGRSSRAVPANAKRPAAVSSC